MGDGGEMEAWRGTLRARALLGVGRAEEALELAEWATAIARERGDALAAALALLALAQARRRGRRRGRRGGARRGGRGCATRLGQLQTLRKIEVGATRRAGGRYFFAFRFLFFGFFFARGRLDGTGAGADRVGGVAGGVRPDPPAVGF